MHIKAPEHHNFEGMRTFLEKRNDKTKSKYDIRFKPCGTCVILAMCKHKRDLDIINCPLLYPIFYKIALNLKHPSAEECEIVRIDPLTMTFWIQRDSLYRAHVDVIRDGVLEFISIAIQFDVKDISENL